MKSKAIIPMLVGVGIGLLALKLGWNYIEKTRLSAEASQGDAPVVVARQAIPPGVALQLADLKVIDWPRTAVPADAHTDTAELVGRVTKTSLGMNLPVLETMLAPPGTSPGLSALIPPGYQAMAVKVDEFRGVGGFLKPGDMVDVVATFSVQISEKSPSETVTRTILRNIEVRTVGQVVQADENGQPNIVRSVTLLVKPEQAQILSLAATRGTITLALRSGQGGESSTDQLRWVTFSELLNPRSDETPSGQKSEEVNSWIKNFFSSRNQQHKLLASKPELRTVAEQVDPIWPVRMIRGPKIERIVFENSTSSERMDPGAAEFQR